MPGARGANPHGFLTPCAPDHRDASPDQGARRQEAVRTASGSRGRDGTPRGGGSRHDQWPSLALTAAVLAPVVAGALLSMVRDLITNNNAALVLVLVVVAVAATGHRVAGLVAAVVSAASFDFFLTQPYLQFAITERDDIEAAVLLALIGLAVTEIALWGRRQQARSSTRAGYLRVSSPRPGSPPRAPPRRPTSPTSSPARSATSSTSTPARSSPARPTPTGPGWTPMGHHLARQCRRRRPGGPADARRDRAAADVRGRRARALPAGLDQRRAPPRPGTPPGRRHAGRAGGRGPQWPRGCRS